MATVPEGATEVFDKTAADIQTGAVLGDDGITATLTYIADWTSAGFDMSKGHHFLAIHGKTTTDGASIVAACVPSQGSATPGFTDDDCVMQVTEDTTAIKFTIDGPTVGRKVVEIPVTLTLSPQDGGE